MGLVDLQLDRRYRTGRQDLVRDFYVPCLSEASSYRRAVGYFTSGALALAAQGLRRLVDRGGRVQLVASPHFNADDIVALQRGLDARQDVLERALLRNLLAPPLAAQQRRLELVAWLLAEGHLEIKIATMTGAKTGIFHEKIGILTDATSTVAFSGSANETEAAHVGNFESFSVYRDWHAAEIPWVDEIVRDFTALWEDETPGLEIIDLPEALSAEILRARPRDNYVPPDDPDETAARPDTNLFPQGLPRLPPDLELRDYQKAAIKEWFDANGRGILEMATGTGKTVTALTTATQLRKGLHEQAQLPLVVVVVCPYVNLVRQWAREFARFGVRPLIASDSSSQWRQPLRDILAGVRLGAINFAAVVTTNTTLSGRSFQGLIDQLPNDTMIIADEVHNLGTERLADALPGRIRYRLGLSATPERWMDTEGTRRIRDNFGESIYRLSLEQAIADGHLCTYDYYPLIVGLDDDEREKYLDVSAKIARLAAMEGSELVPSTAGGRLELLLFERARLIGAARQKLPAALRAAAAHKAEGGVIVYCSDASDYGGEGARVTTRQVDQVVGGLCTPPISMAASRYTFDESPRRRAELESQFSDRLLDALVAIRCLDEGVDIPSTRTAIIMASTTNPRQFIQRRGRVLRKFPGKKRATIYDLVVSPGDPEGLPHDIFNVERRIFRKELIRVTEFARSAENGREALHELLDLRTAWNCLDV